MFLVPLVAATVLFVLCRWLVARVLGYRADALLPRRGSVGRRLAVACASPLVLLPVSIVGSLVIYGVGGVPQSTPTVQITDVRKDSPAARAGLQIGDELTMVDGHPVSPASPAPALVAATAGRPFTVVVLRGGERLELPVTAEAGRIGVGLAPQTFFTRSPDVVLKSAVTDPLRYYGLAVATLAQAAVSGGHPVELAAPIAIVKNHPHRVEAVRLLLWGICLSTMLWGLLLGLILFAVARPKPPAP